MDADYPRKWVIFACRPTLDDKNWMPHTLYALVETLKVSEQDDFRLHILRTMETIAVVMQRELADGLDAFYLRVDEVIKHGPEQAWDFMEKFTGDIWGVGPVLMSDFLKNVGYPNFVKIDIHLNKEFPELLPGKKGNSKALFVQAWHLCEVLEMTPFVLDHILYQWGRATSKSGFTKLRCRYR